MFLCPLNCKARSFYIEIKSILSTAGLRTTLFIGSSCDNPVLHCSRVHFLEPRMVILNQELLMGASPPIQLSEVNYIRALSLNKNWQIYKTMLSRINKSRFSVSLTVIPILIQPFWRKVLWIAYLLKIPEELGKKSDWTWSFFSSKIKCGRVSKCNP